MCKDIDSNRLVLIACHLTRRALYLSACNAPVPETSDGDLMHNRRLLQLCSHFSPQAGHWSAQVQRRTSVLHYEVFVEHSFASCKLNPNDARSWQRMLRKLAAGC